MPPDSLDLPRFRQATVAANDLHSRLRQKYPDLHAYLVLALPGDQSSLNGDIDEQAKEFPALLTDDSAKQSLLAYLKIKIPKDATDLQRKERRERIATLSRSLRFNPAVQVELRFRRPDFELLEKLRVDDLVDRALTPQTRASIRIVLGTLASFDRITRESGDYREPTR